MTGVLAGIEDASREARVHDGAVVHDGSAIDFRECEHFVGTSAGSIVAALLASGRPPKRPRLEPVSHAAARGSRDHHVSAAAHARDWGLALASPLVAPGLRLLERPGGLARSLALRATPAPHRSLGDLQARIDATGVRFDGRLRLVAVDRARGRRVVFGCPGAPDATVGEAVQASCSVPWLFPPTQIGGREYVDGATWSMTSIDAAPARRQTRVLCLAPTASLRSTPTAAAIGVATRIGVTVESGVLKARGARVTVIAPDAESTAVLDFRLMDPAPRDEALAAGYRQGLAAGC